MKPMTGLKPLALTGALLTVLVAGAPAHADTPPNVWDIAKDPLVRDRYDVHLASRQALMLPRVATRTMREVAYQRARGMLEDAGAENSPDVRLRFDLGELYQTMDRHDRAIAILKPALASAPDHPGAADAALALAYAYAKLDRPRDERDAYQLFLARTTDERARVTALLNLAEAEMRLGNMADAVTGYRDAVQCAAALPNTTGTSQTAVLAVWGLAVALDRSGDPSGAAQQAKLATELDFGGTVIGDTVNVFFVPEYERFWYFALGAVERAKAAKDARTAVLRWSHAETLWISYVTQAEKPQNADKWITLARAHRDFAHAEKLAAQKRAAKTRAPAADDGEDTVIP